jgi:hypothetical protein
MGRTRGVNVQRFDGNGPDVLTGDEITVVGLHWNKGKAEHGRSRSDVRQARVTDRSISNGFNQRGFVWTGDDGYREHAWLSDEHVSWIRGWHEPTSSEVTVLLAAGLLARSAA